MLVRRPKCLATVLATNLALLLSGSSKALASTSPGREGAKSTASGRGIAPQKDGGGLRQPSSPASLDCDTEFVGDGYCDRHLNTADCGKRLLKVECFELVCRPSPDPPIATNAQSIGTGGQSNPLLSCGSLTTSDLDVRATVETKGEVVRRRRVD